MTSVSSLTQLEIETINHILLKPEGVLAFPTDTVYGLGCMINNPKAVEKIYKIKGRDIIKPLILLGTSLDVLKKYVQEMPENLMGLIESSWPGPLTVVLPKTSLVPDYITSNMDTVGIRVPDHPLLLDVLKNCTSDGVLATTSANISNQVELNSKESILKVMGNNIDYIIDNTDLSISGRPSTIVSLDKNDEIIVLRQGALIID